jgi:hypothetical protein
MAGNGVHGFRKNSTLRWEWVSIAQKISANGAMDKESLSTKCQKENKEI